MIQKRSRYIRNSITKIQLINLRYLLTQTLKQNTEPANDMAIEKRSKESVATQTPGRTNSRVQTAVVTSTRPIRTLVSFLRASI